MCFDVIWCDGDVVWGGVHVHVYVRNFTSFLRLSLFLILSFVVLFFHSFSYLLSLFLFDYFFSHRTDTILHLCSF